MLIHEYLDILALNVHLHARFTYMNTQKNLATSSMMNIYTCIYM